MAAGVTDWVWAISNIVALLEAAENAPEKQTQG